MARNVDSLHESEMDCRQILDTMPKGCQIVGFDWRYRYINGIAEKHNRRLNAELLGRTVMECWPGITETQSFTLQKSCMEERTTHNLDKKFAFSDGYKGWYRLTIQPATEGIVIFSEDIADYIQAKVELRQFFTFFETSADMMCIVDPNGAFKRINPSCMKMLGYSEAELVTRPFIEFVHPDDKQETLDEIVKQQHFGHSSAFENRYLCKDSSFIWLSWRAVYNKNEKSTYAIARDITLRKAAETALMLSEVRYRTVVEDQTEIICRIKENGTFTFVNDVYCRFFGKTREELLGSKWYPDAFPDDVLMVEEQLLRLSLSNPVVTIENRVISGSGAIRWMQFVDRGFFDKEGRLIEIQVVGRDITVRKEAESALLTSDERLTFALAASGMGVWDWNVQTNAIYRSPECYKILGEASFTGTLESFTNVVHPDDVDRVITAAKQALIEKAPFSVEFRIICPDGQLRWLSDQARPAYDEKGSLLRLIGTVHDITERKNAEIALCENQELLQAVINGTNDAVFVKDIGSRILLANPAYLRIIGKLPEEILGMNPHEIYSDRNIAATILENDQQIMESGHAEVLEETVEGPAGRHVFLSSKTPRLDAKGRVSGLIVVSHDITERQQREDTLRESEAKFRSYIDKAPDGVFVVDETGGYLEVNLAASNITGYSEAELLAMSTSDLLPPEDVETGLYCFQSLKETGYVRCELEYLHKDGTVRLWLLDAVKLSESRYLAFTKDITEQKKVQEALLESEERYRSLVEQMREGLSSSNSSFIITFANSRFLEILGLTAEEVIGRGLHTLFDGQQGKIIQEQFPIRKGGETSTYQLAITKKDGTKSYLEVKGSPRFNQNGQFAGSIAVITDVTDRTLTEIELRTSHERLRQLSAHLESTRENERLRISREVHDELGQSLTALKLDLVSLRRNHAFPVMLIPRLVAMQETVSTTIGSVQRITAELRPRCLDDLGLAAAIQWQAKDFSKRAGIPCRVELCDVPELSPEYLISIIRILQESLTNVLRHAEASDLVIALVRDKSWLSLAVSDNGRGITDHQLTAKNSFGLMGMHERASLCGGILEITSTIGQGTVVMFRIPLENSKET